MQSRSTTTWPDRFRAALATGLGLGYVPVAPGTAGTLTAAAVFVAIVWAAPASLHLWLIAAALAASCVISVLITPWAERYWGRKDPGHFVLDEIAGFLLTVLLFYPFHAAQWWLTLVWAFGASRFFDILKPPPVRQLERLPAGWGVLLDDLCASVYAAGLLHILVRVWPTLFGMGT